MKTSRFAVLSLAAALLGAPAFAADKVSFKDPSGDDNGPGTYKYPTDPVYKRGSFDLTDFTFEKKGTKADITLGFNTTLADEWKTGSGFAVQMAFIFIDTDGKEGSGSTDSLPGLNVKFAPNNGWEKGFVISPQNSARVKAEVGNKAGAAKDNVLIPTRTKGSGRKVSATVDLAGLEGGQVQDLVLHPEHLTGPGIDVPPTHQPHGLGGRGLIEGPGQRGAPVQDHLTVLGVLQADTTHIVAPAPVSDGGGTAHAPAGAGG